MVTLLRIQHVRFGENVSFDTMRILVSWFHFLDKFCWSQKILIVMNIYAYMYIHIYIYVYIYKYIYIWSLWSTPYACVDNTLMPLPCFICLIYLTRDTVSQPLTELTLWGRVTHTCASNPTIIGSDNGLSPGRRQAITWTNVGILLIGPLGTNVTEMVIEIHTFSFKQIHLKMSSGKWRSSCLGLNVLNRCVNYLRTFQFIFKNLPR